MSKNIVNNDDNKLEKTKFNKEIQTIRSAKLRNNFNAKNLNIPQLDLNKNLINNNLIISKENNRNKCIFSNNEIKKHINDEDKNLTLNNNNENLINKITIPFDNKIKNYRNRLLINSINSIKDRIYYSVNKKKKEVNKELKEESTNTYSNNIFLQDINDSNSLSPGELLINSKGRFRNNIINDTQNKRFLKTRNNFKNYFIPKEKENFFKKNNKNYFSQSNMLITNIDKTPTHNNSVKSNVRDIVIDNSNIKNYEEANKNRLKYYIDIYNYHLIQSIIQNRSNYFNMKNTNIFPFQLFKYINKNNDFNINGFLYNINANSFSIRELYRNMNKENYASHSNFKKNKNSHKKKKKQSFEFKAIKNNIKVNIKKKCNLTNLQYDFDTEKNKNKLDNLILRKKYTNLDTYKNIKNDDEFQYFKRKKFVGNYFENLIRRNKNNIKNDILEIGLINSSSQVKIGKSKENDLNEKNKQSELTKIQINF